VLEGDAATGPLGATVTIRFTGGGVQSDVSAPIGALIDDGNRTGILGDQPSFVPVTIKRLAEETRRYLRHRNRETDRGARCASS
jgi:hypothetical protein